MDTNSQGDQQDNNAEQLATIDLLEHLMQEYWGMRYQGEKPQLLPQKLPDSLPFEVPIPENARLIGSVLWPDAANILFDSPTSRDKVVRFYDEQLLSRGWTKPEIPNPFGGGGFTNSRHGFDIGASYCLGEKGPSLNLRAFNLDTQPLTIQITVSTNPELSPCSPRMRRQHQSMRLGTTQIFPELQPPEGSLQMGHGGMGGGSDSASTNAMLSTELKLSAILPHYDRQLARAGWKQVDGGESAIMGWSTWEFMHEEEQWRGFLTIIAKPWAEGKYRLTLYAEVESYGQHGGIIFEQF